MGLNARKTAAERFYGIRRLWGANTACDRPEPVPYS